MYTIHIISSGPGHKKKDRYKMCTNINNRNRAKFSIEKSVLGLQKGVDIHCSYQIGILKFK